MKITVITDKTGKVVGTAHYGIKSSPGSGDGGPVAGPHQRVRVIDLPGVEEVEAAAELHRKAESIARQKTKRAQAAKKRAQAAKSVSGQGAQKSLNGNNRAVNLAAKRGRAKRRKPPVAGGEIISFAAFNPERRMA
jgi:hypothetical protein